MSYWLPRKSIYFSSSPKHFRMLLLGDKCIEQVWRFVHVKSVLFGSIWFYLVVWVFGFFHGRLGFTRAVLGAGHVLGRAEERGGAGSGRADRTQRLVVGAVSIPKSLSQVSPCPVLFFLSAQLRACVRVLCPFCLISRRSLASWLVLSRIVSMKHVCSLACLVYCWLMCKNVRV